MKCVQILPRGDSADFVASIDCQKWQRRDGDCVAPCSFYSLHEAMKKKMFVGVSALMTPGRPTAGSP